MYDSLNTNTTEVLVKHELTKLSYIEYSISTSPCSLLFHSRIFKNLTSNLNSNNPALSVRHKTELLCTLIYVHDKIDCDIHSNIKYRPDVS